MRKIDFISLGLFFVSLLAFGKNLAWLACILMIGLASILMVDIYKTIRSN